MTTDDGVEFFIARFTGRRLAEVTTATRSLKSKSRPRNWTLSAYRTWSGAMVIVACGTSRVQGESVRWSAETFPAGREVGYDDIKRVCVGASDGLYGRLAKALGICEVVE